MSSPAMRQKRKMRIRNHIAKDLHSTKYRQRVVKDRHGRRHDLGTMTYRDLVEAIQENDNGND